MAGNRNYATVFLLGDAGDVAAPVEDPDMFGGQALLEEDHVGLHTLAVGVSPSLTASKCSRVSRQKVGFPHIGQRESSSDGLLGQGVFVK